MKKSELKALIREVIEEIDSPVTVKVWEVYERDGTGCVAYLNKEDAQNSEVFENGYDRIVQSTVIVSPKELNTLKSGGFIISN